MTERSLAILLLPLALALAACDTPPPPPPSLAATDVPKQLEATPQQLDYQVSFPARSATLMPAQAVKLNAFLDKAAVKPQEHLLIAAADTDPLALARVNRVVTVLARRGIGARRISPPPSGLAANHVLLVLKRYVVQFPTCPDWSADPDQEHTNRPASNFGCATMVNLGMMIEDPRDLAVGRTMGPAPAEPTIGANERYRTDKVKATSSPTASGGSGQSGGAGGASSGGSTAPQQ